MKLGLGTGLSSSVNHLFDIIPSFNVKRWYAADSVKADMGNNVSIMYDKSGNGGDAIQLTGSAQPKLRNNGGQSFNKRPVVRFSGPTHFLNIADFDYVDYTNLNIFAVAKITDFTDSSTIVSHSNLVNEHAWSLFTLATAKVRMTIGEDGTNVDKVTDNSTALVITKAYLFSTKFDSTSLKMSLNGIDESVIISNDPMTKFFDSPSPLMIGAITVFGTPVPSMIGDIAEIIITTDLTATQISFVNAFSMNKYNPS